MIEQKETNFSYCLTDEEYHKIDLQKIEQAVTLFQSIEKMLTTEAGTPAREQIKNDFIKNFTGIESW